MKRALVMAIALATCGAAAAEFAPPERTAGGGRAMINLVSPADSATQISRGVLMIGGRGRLMGAPRAGVAAGGRQILVMLRLAGVSAAGVPVDSADNHLLLDGRLSTAAGEDPVSIDAPFAVVAGSAFVSVPLGLPAGTGVAALLIDQVSVVDAAATTLAVPGIAFNVGAPQVPTPRPTPTSPPGCGSASDCDDGDPGTRDLCTPGGCRHVPEHMGDH